ncbi:hypothetical protein KY389_14795 [Paracoccus bogoriensis]|uniref:hypothetical protein n=1 Tax=Paracoccus bogoriensis TaxID=242065 RepID=UPI001CA4CD5E|nr:hypothetical protein [Paracoccus bogoriensis]MBW7057922.1 hypothetical protein [Paracoccus bogoriensis]
MAKLSDLVPTLAQVLPMPEQTVAVIARALRQARLISTGGRGPGAADMTPEDCARLLLAIMAADQVKDSVAASQRFWAFPVEELHSRDTMPEDEQDAWLPLPDAMRALTQVTTLGEMLAGLIAAARDGALDAALGGVMLPFMKIEVERRFHTASVSLAGSSDGLLPDRTVMIASFAPPKTQLRKLMEASGFHEGGDAMVTFAVSQRTINPLGALIRT